MMASIRKAEAIFSWLNIKIGPYFAVQQRGIPGETGNPDRMVGVDTFVWIKQLAVVLERSVLNQERDLERASGKIELIFSRVSQQVKACQSRVHVESCDAERMVVVPEGTTWLVIWIVIGPGLARGKPIARIPIAFRASMDAV